MSQKSFIRFIGIWLVNTLIIWVASMLYPTNLVLGTANYSVLVAAILSGFLVTLLCKIAKVLLVKVGNFRLKGRILMFVVYWVINAVSIWLIARLSPFTGLGISSFQWAFILGFALNFFQWVSRQIFKAAKLTTK